MALAKTEIRLNLIELWGYHLADAIEEYNEHIDFSTIPPADFKDECINYLIYCFDNEMLGSEINYKDIVYDTAKSYNMWNW